MKLKILLLAVMLAGIAMADPEIPKERPVAATIFAGCDPATHSSVIVALVVSYADGTVLRIDGKQTHGFTSPQQIVNYGLLAKDQFSYVYGCPSAQ